MKSKSVLVVGAGPGGLASAMLLAHKGFSVTVFEKQARVGGRTGRIERGGYRFDVGSTMLMLRSVLDGLFALVGRRSTDYLTFHRLDPMYRLVIGDNVLDISADRDKTAATIEQLFPGGAARYRTFLAREQKRFLALYPCLQRDYPSLSSMAEPSVLRALPHVNLLRSTATTMRDYFGCDELQTAFSFNLLFLGMSPWKSPGVFSMLPLIEHGWGVHHVRGGINAICDAMRLVVEECGGVVHMETPVRRVLTGARHALGVELADGSRVEADEVVVNADFGHAAANLFAPGALPAYTPRKLDALRYSCSMYMLYLGLDEVLPLPHHSLIFSSSYRAEIETIFDRNSIPDDFSVYLCNPSVTDASMAPSGHSSLTAVVLAPNTKDADIDWRTMRMTLRDRVVQRISSFLARPDLEARIREQVVITPWDWEHRLDIRHGAIYNLRHELRQLLALRPPNRLRPLDNVYLVGGGTHPGSGLPLIFESAKIAERLICRAHGYPESAIEPLQPAFA
jgi:phytoene desaturase